MRGRREIHEVEAVSDYVATLLTYYEAICLSMDRWISVSWSFASIFIPASMVLAGIVLSMGLRGWMAVALSAVCLLITVGWGLLWYRTYTFNVAHLDQLAAIERHLCELLGVPAELCPQLTIVKRLRSKFGWKSKVLRIKHVIAAICCALAIMWSLMLVSALLGLVA